MRSVLLTIPLRGTIELGALGVVPLFGMGLLLAVWALLGLVAAGYWWRHHRASGFPGSLAFVWCAVAAGLYGAPQFADKIPVYGYGTMLFVGFLVAGGIAAKRLAALGGDPDWAWDVAMWIFIPGIIGARTFFIIQYQDRFFVPGRSMGEILRSLVNLPDGGLVFFGGLIFAPFAFVWFCRTRNVNPLAFGDIVITSVFIGMAFGRLGCFLNGCCYGDVCDLPWAVTFPPDSVPYRVQVFQGFLESTATASLPLHPTQIYSALNATVLAIFTWAYYPYRRFHGEALALGWIAYPISRFLVEFIRGDELGQFGTAFTISQWVSLGLCAAGVLFYAWQSRRAAPVAA